MSAPLDTSAYDRDVYAHRPSASPHNIHTHSDPPPHTHPVDSRPTHKTHRVVQTYAHELIVHRPHHTRDATAPRHQHAPLPPAAFPPHTHHSTHARPTNVSLARAQWARSMHSVDEASESRCGAAMHAETADTAKRQQRHACPRESRPSAYRQRTVSVPSA